MEMEMEMGIEMEMEMVTVPRKQAMVYIDQGSSRLLR